MDRITYISTYNKDLSPEEIIDAQFNLQPIGSGPFSFDQFRSKAIMLPGLPWLPSKITMLTPPSSNSLPSNIILILSPQYLPTNPGRFWELARWQMISFPRLYKKQTWICIPGRYRCSQLYFYFHHPPVNQLATILIWNKPTTNQPILAMAWQDMNV